MKLTRYTLPVALMISLGAFAQPPVDDQDDGLQMTATFVGNAELVVKDANKQSSIPELKLNIVEIPPITYNLLANKLNVQIEPKLIKPAKVNVEQPLTKLYRGYARGGFGLYTTTLGELYYMDGRSRNGTFSMHVKHLGSAGGVASDPFVPDNFSRNEIHLWGKRFVKKHTLEGGFDWEKDVLHYYGFNTELFPNIDLDALKQSFNNIDGYLQLKSYYRDTAKVNYHGRVKFYNYRDNFSGNESNLDVAAHIRQYKGNELFSVDFDVNYNQFQFKWREDTPRPDQYTNTIVTATPTASTIHDKWKILAGASIVYDAKGTTPFHFYPKAEANYSLLNNLFIPYVGIDGNLKRTTYKSITRANPFVITNPELRALNTKLNAYGGIRGTISSQASFNAKLAWTNYDNFMYFVNDSIASPGNQFQIIYDGLKITNLTGEVSISVSDDFKLFGRGDYFIYSLGSEKHAWNQPTTRASIAASYNLANKFMVNLEAYTVGKRFAKSLVPVKDVDPNFDGSYTVDMKGYADVNLSVEYRYTKRLSAFVKFNNVFAAKYEIWNNYNVQRFNALMGASYSF